MTHTPNKRSSALGIGENDQARQVFGYARVGAHSRGDESYSLAEQEAQLRGYAQSLGWSLTRVFVESGSSGARRLHTRPRGAEMLSILRPGDHLIATKLDRLFRSATDALQVVEDFRVRGLHLHVLDVGGDVTGKGATAPVFSVLAAVAGMERERVGEAVRAGKQQRRDAGYFTGGKLARGYHVTDDGHINRDAAWEQCIALMKQLHRDHVPYRRIAEQVKEQFQLEIDYSTVYRVLNGKRGLDAVSEQEATTTVPPPTMAEPEAKTQVRTGQRRRRKAKEQKS